MKKKSTLVISGILALASPALLLAVWDRLPAQVITTWGFDGAVTGTGGKENLWALALMGPLFLVMFAVLPKIDPKRKNYQKFQNHYDSFCVAFQLFILAVNGAGILENLRPGTISIGRVVTVLIGFLFLSLGNIMPTIKHNYFMGLKTPWTLADPAVWERANRLAGRLFFWCGLVTIPIALLLPERLFLWLFLAMVLGVGLVPGVMSYFWYRRLHPADGEE